jgi:hypothetical protein
MGSLLDAESRHLAREQRWTEIGDAYERLRRDEPEGWQEYLDELDSWQEGSTAPDDSAASEWPEYHA